MMNSKFNNSWQGRVGAILSAILSAIALTSCTNITTNEYVATAKTTYTWQVKYSLDPTSAKTPRFETFTSTSLVNRNGIKPAGAVIGPEAPPGNSIHIAIIEVCRLPVELSH